MVTAVAWQLPGLYLVGSGSMCCISRLLNRPLLHIEGQKHWPVRYRHGGHWWCCWAVPQALRQEAEIINVATRQQHTSLMKL